MPVVSAARVHERGDAKELSMTASFIGSDAGEVRQLLRRRSSRAQLHEGVHVGEIHVRTEEMLTYSIVKQPLAKIRCRSAAVLARPHGSAAVAETKREVTVLLAALRGVDDNTRQRIRGRSEVAPGAWSG